MRKILIFACLLFTTSCASLNGAYERLKTKEPVVDNSAEIEKARLQEFLNHRNLHNTINLKIGQSKKDVLGVLLDPSSVAAFGNETIWQYNLYRYPDAQSQIIPFKVMFNGENVSRFGIDQEQIERDRAKVIIQKDIASEKEK